MIDKKYFKAAAARDQPSLSDLNHKFISHPPELSAPIALMDVLPGHSDPEYHYFWMLGNKWEAWYSLSL
jgi:hypothetical protein